MAQKIETMKRYKPISEKEHPYLDSLEPKQPTGKLSGGLVEPSGRTAKVIAPAPNEETSPAEDHNPGNPGRPRPFGVSKSYDVYNGHSGEGTSGAIETQSDGQGRALPPATAVTEAKEETGVAAKCIKEQVGENRYAINSHVAEKKEFGPNN